MEVLVEAAEGVPSDAVLSLRLGNLRRQAPLSSALMHPLRFATSLADACEPLRIDVLRPVATARQVLRQEELRYTVPLEGMQDMAVRLSVRPTERSACDTDADAQPPSHDAAARDYLEQHKVLQYLQSMLHALIQAKPPDPFSYMVSQLSNAQQPPRRRKASWPERAQREPTCQESWSWPLTPATIRFKERRSRQTALSRMFRRRWRQILQIWRPACHPVLHTSSSCGRFVAAQKERRERLPGSGWRGAAAGPDEVATAAARCGGGREVGGSSGKGCGTYGGPAG
ncbi:unnamed protein product [Effrenium voratum]|nr:unnamed protein product [Effrenium voratum]